METFSTNDILQKIVTIHNIVLLFYNCCDYKIYYAVGVHKLY